MSKQRKTPGHTSTVCTIDENSSFSWSEPLLKYLFFEENCTNKSCKKKSTVTYMHIILQWLHATTNSPLQTGQLTETIKWENRCFSWFPQWFGWSKLHDAIYVLCLTHVQYKRFIWRGTGWMELNRVKKGLPPSTLRTKKQTICMHKCQNTYNIIIFKKHTNNHDWKDSFPLEIS